MLRRLILVSFALVLGCLHARASVTLTATLTDGTGATSKTAYLHFQLENCGANFPVDALSPLVLVQTQFDLRLPTPGVGAQITGTVLGNDEIKCGGVFSTYYLVTPMKDQTHPLGNGIPYQFCDVQGALSQCGNTGTPFDLSAAVPMTTTATLPTPGYVPIFANAAINQTWNQPTGTSAKFVGTFDFTNATLLGLPGLAVTSQVCTASGTYHVATYQTTTLIYCDPNFFSNGSGAVTAVSITTSDSTQAGAISLNQGPAPTGPPANGVQFAAQSSVTGYRYYLPSAVAGALGDVLCAASLSGNIATGGWCTALSDPGSNGIVKRTGLNVDTIAASSDVVGLWSGTCNSSTFLGGDGTCRSGSGVTFQVNGTGLTSQSTVNFQNSAAFNGLTFTFANPSNGNVQLGASGTLNNSGLTNSSTTVNGQTCTLGSTCTVSGAENTQTASYTLATGDLGKLVVMNCSSACTLTLNGSPTNGYYGAIESIGSSVATVSLNTKQFNGSTSVPVLDSNRILFFWSDGTNYFGTAPLVAGTGLQFVPSSNGFTINVASVPNSALQNSSVSYNGVSVSLGGTGTIGCAGGGVNAQTASYTLVSGDNNKLVTLNGTSLTATLPSSAPTSPWCATIENLASSAVTVARNGLTINGGTSNITLQQYQMTTIWSDGTNYLAKVPAVAGTNITLTENPTGETYSSTASGGGGGTNTYTANQTASSSDNGKLVKLNCTSACTYTLPNPQPSTTFTVTVQSVGSTLATIALGSSMTWNGSSTAPVLVTNSVLVVYAATDVSTAYVGGQYGTALSGNTTTQVTATGTLTSGDYASWDANGNAKDSGVAITPSQATWVFAAGGTGSTTAITANTTKIWEVTLPVSVTTANVAYYIATADNTADLYDIGLYDVNGNLKLHVGATAGTTLFPSSGAKHIAWAASATLLPGRYYIAFTGNAATAVLGGQALHYSAQCGVAPATNSTTSGGALNGSVTFSADSPAVCGVPQILLY